jgi:hypothetical protein
LRVWENLGRVEIDFGEIVDIDFREIDLFLWAVIAATNQGPDRRALPADGLVLESSGTVP